jgi:nucleoside-diphosphate-sugar epimerase
MGVNLVTGGSGYVGGHIVEHLVDQGEDVRVFDVVPPEVCADKVEYVKGDVRDFEALSAAMKNVDVVYHNVALVPVTKAGEKFWQVNVGGTKNALRAARQGDVDRFVQMSSSSIYSLDDIPITEESPLEPKGDYSGSKLEADKFVQNASGINTTIIRPRTVVGRRRGGIFAILFEWIQHGRRVYTVGDGSNVFQMVSGSDLARATVAAGRRPEAAGEIYNIGCADFGTMREAYQALVGYANTGSSVVGLPAAPTKFGMRMLDFFDASPLTTFHYKTIDADLCFNISKARRDLNWSPEHSNADCMRRGYQWYVDNERNQETDGQSEEVQGHRKQADQGLLRILRKLS